MKKIALLIALAAVTATPALAASKKQMTFDEGMAYNKKDLSLVVQALPLVLPSWSLPIYFGMHKDAGKAKPGKRK